MIAVWLWFSSAVSSAWQAAFSLLGSESHTPWERVCLDIPPPHKRPLQRGFVTPITALPVKHSSVWEPMDEQQIKKQITSFIVNIKPDGRLGAARLRYGPLLSRGLVKDRWLLLYSCSLKAQAGCVHGQSARTECTWSFCLGGREGLCAESRPPLTCTQACPSTASRTLQSLAFLSMSVG